MYPGMMNVVEDGVVDIDIGPPINFCDFDEPELFFDAKCELDQQHVQHLIHDVPEPGSPSLSMFADADDI